MNYAHPMSSSTFDTNSGKAPGTQGHDIPAPNAMAEFMKVGWAASPLDNVVEHPSVPFTRLRRDKVSKQFLGKRLVIPAGTLKVRSNDSDYRFRAHTAFAWLTGIDACDTVPDSVLVLEPNSSGHEALLFIHPRSPRNNNEFYTNRQYGEFWIGRRMTLEETQTRYGIKVALIETLPDFLAQEKETLTVRKADPAIDSRIPLHEHDEEFHRFLSVARIVKDPFEISEMQKACDSTARGFADMVRVFPAAKAHPRGERIIEAAFYGRARSEGNDIGYDSIVASGTHACVLHWIRNDGAVKDGDLILIDAGVERESHFTADVTRTLPVNGKFTEAQKNLYMIVLRAQAAGFAAVKPGAKFKDIHAAAMVEIAKGAAALGVLPVSIEDSLKPENGLHRRWMFHGTSHQLGMDVHDCGEARREQVQETVLEPGMVLTVEPGFYIQPDDELFPVEYRGIGIRIEDDVLVTETGHTILSDALPRHPDEIEVWMANLLR